MIDMIFYDCEGKWLLLADATKVWGKISCRLDKKHHMRYKSLSNVLISLLRQYW